MFKKIKEFAHENPSLMFFTGVSVGGALVFYMWNTMDTFNAGVIREISKATDQLGVSEQVTQQMHKNLFE